MDINKQSHLAKNAKNALQNHLEEQEERKKAAIKEQHIRDLRQLEANLFHKQQEIIRITKQLERLKRERVVRDSKFKNSAQGIQQQNHIHELERQIKSVEQSLKEKVDEITAKINQKQRELEELKKQKQEIVMETESQERELSLNIKRTEAELSSVERHRQTEKRILDTTQKQISTLEQSARIFNQDITVLTNKIKALKALIQ